MQYFGIKKPDGVIWWIAESQHASWMSFFQYPSDKNTLNAHRLPLAEAIEAYTAIGYRCVELKVQEVNCAEIDLETDRHGWCERCACNNCYKYQQRAAGECVY